MADEDFHYRTPDRNSFGFHISMAYQLRALTVAERRDYHNMVIQHIPDPIAATSVTALGIPEFCTFGDMYRFEIQSFLRS